MKKSLLIWPLKQDPAGVVPSGRDFDCGQPEPKADSATHRHPICHAGCEPCRAAPDGLDSFLPHFHKGFAPRALRSLNFSTTINVADCANKLKTAKTH
jgi:hypothetical protein